MKSKTLVFATLLVVTAFLLIQAIAPCTALAASTWTNTGGGVSSYDIYSLAYDSGHNLLYAGCYDASTGIGKGVWKYNGATWTDTGGGVSSYEIDSLAYDSAHNLLYAGTINHGVWRYNGTSWTDTGGGVSSYRVYGLAFDSVHNLLYAGFYDESTNTAEGVRMYNGTTWTNTGGGFPDAEASTSLAYDSGNNMLYAGTDSNWVWKYDGTTWTYTGGGWSQGYVECLACDSTHNLLYAAIGAVGGVWKYDGTTWTNIGGQPSAGYINCLTYDSGNNLLYVGGRGVGVGQYDGTTWTDTGGGMHNYNIFSLACDSTHNMLYAGTSYSGVWYYNPSAPAPPPTITSITPSSKTAGNPAFTLTVNGTNFNTDSVVRWNGSARTTTYVSDTRVTAAITATDIATAGTASVTVSNPTPGGGTSTPALLFTVNNPNPVPTATTLSPTSKTAGQPAFTLTVNGTNFINGSKVRWNGSNRTTTYVSPTKLTASIPASDIATAGTASVTVYTPTPGGGTSNAQTFTITKPPTPPPTPPTPTTTPTWYLAEGTTAWGFSDYISIENPNTGAVHAAITYMTGTGNVSGGTITLPAQSQTTVNPADKLGNKDFSTKVVCTEGETIAVDRTMSWTGPGAASPEGHSSVGVTAPSGTWYLPEGSSNWGFECWLLIQNPNGSTANCTATYMIEGEAPVVKTKTVPGNSRQSFNMATDIGSKDASIKVESNVPVIPERAMYRNNRREGHDSIGTTTPAADYYLAEGATGYNVGYITYVLVQNPQGTPTNVTLTYMTQNGQVAGPSFQMPANSRKTVKVNDTLPPNTDVSTHVHGSQPIIAERAMYWDNGTGEACHDSIGMGQPHATFYLPDGETSNGRETWTLVQNPNSTNVTVEISYLTPNGQGNVVKTETIPANSRKTFNMASHSGINGRAAIMVTSKTSGKKIMVERAMYWNNRGAGTDTIGGYGD